MVFQAALYFLSCIFSMNIVPKQWTPEQVKSLLKKYKLEQKDLAEMLGVQPHHLSNMIRQDKFQYHHFWALTAIEERLQQSDHTMKTLTEHIIPSDVLAQPVYFSSTMVSFYLLLQRMNSNLLSTAPAYKHAAWDRVKESRYIESLLMQIPTGAFWIDGRNDESWQILDGCSRLLALREFLQGDFKLTSLEYLTMLEGQGYPQLSRTLQRRIDETNCMLYIVRGATSDAIVHNIAAKLGHPLR